MCVEMHWILNFIKTYNMKILQVAFLLLFNYLDSLPKLYFEFVLAAPQVGSIPWLLAQQSCTLPLKLQTPTTILTHWRVTFPFI